MEGLRGRFKYLHDLLARLQLLLLLDRLRQQRAVEREEHPTRVDPGQERTSTRAELLATAGQKRWPRAGTYMAATGHDLMAADTLNRSRLAQADVHTTSYSDHKILTGYFG